MPSPTQSKIEAALPKVRSQDTFIQKLLVDALDWPVPDEITQVENMAYGWSPEDLRAPGLADYLDNSQVWQIQPFQGNSVWGIFLLEFRKEDIFTTGRGIAGPLRQVLR